MLDRLALPAKGFFNCRTLDVDFKHGALDVHGEADAGKPLVRLHANSRTTPVENAARDVAAVDFIEQPPGKVRLAPCPIDSRSRLDEEPRALLRATGLLTQPRMERDARHG